MPPAHEAPKTRRYVLIMTVRDEEKYLQQTLDAIFAQTILPAEMIIVNDGSKDRTGEIADTAAEGRPWIQVLHRGDRGDRKLGGGVVETFYAGYDKISVQDYDYICKIDGDVTFLPGYFEGLMTRCEKDPDIGGISGKTWNPVEDLLVEESMIDEMVAGQVNFWRRACWEEVGGYVRMVMWDGIVFHRAQMLGWKSRSFRDEDIKIIHHRLMGSSHQNIYHGRMRWGRGQWFMGTHPLYILASGVFRMRERPYLVGGLLIIAGYLQAWWLAQPRYEDPRFRQYLHRWQLKRLGLAWLQGGGEKPKE